MKLIKIILMIIDQLIIVGVTESGWEINMVEDIFGCPRDNHDWFFSCPKWNYGCLVHWTSVNFEPWPVPRAISHLYWISFLLGQYIASRFNITYKLTVWTEIPTFVLLIALVHICGYFHLGARAYCFACDFFVVFGISSAF